MFRSIIVAVFGAVLAIADAPCPAEVTPATQPAGSAKTGQFDLTFTQRSPLRPPKELADRLNLKPSEMGDDYDLSKCTFKTYVPANYDPSVPLGIFVYLGYKPSPSIPPLWPPILDKTHLIFITPVWHSGRMYPPAIPLWQSVGVALDAVDNLKKQYAIDGKRIYQMSWNLGATQTALATSDVFTGFVITLDQSWWQPIRAANGGYYPSNFAAPPGRLYSLAKSRPFVLIDDKSSDELANQIALKRAAMQRQSFLYLLQIRLSLNDDLHYPNFSVDWFGQQVLPFLDKYSSSAPAPATMPTAAGGGSTTTSPSRAQSLLSVAQLLIANNQLDLARHKLRQIIDTYPDDPAAAKAKQLLDKIGAH